MSWTVEFFCDSILTGVGYALCAFAAAVALGLCQSAASRKRQILLPAFFAVGAFFFSFLGWRLTLHHAAVLLSFATVSPWISLALSFLSGAGLLLMDVCKATDSRLKQCIRAAEWVCLVAPVIAVGIPAFPAGLFYAALPTAMAVVQAGIRGVCCWLLSFAGLWIGTKSAGRFGRSARIPGGILLVLVGVGICVAGLLG